MRYYIYTHVDAKQPRTEFNPAARVSIDGELTCPQSKGRPLIRRALVGVPIAWDGLVGGDPALSKHGATQLT